MEYALAISAVKHIAVGSSIGEQTQITAAWTNRARSGAEAVANSTPQRRSISPLLIQKAIPTSADNPNSFASIAKKSVGLL